MFLKELVIFYSIMTLVFSLREGDSCTDGYTTTKGRCRRVEKCESAKEDWTKNRITPTYCSYSGDIILVCCRDGNNILQTPWSNVQDGSAEDRVSDSSNTNGVVEDKKNTPCAHKYIYSLGYCAPAEECKSAKDDWIKNRVQPTFCESTSDSPLVCCRDRNNVLERPSSPPSSVTPIKFRETLTESKRLSQQKCKEYSRHVFQTIDYSILLPNGGSYSYSSSKCNFTNLELIIGGEDARVGEFPHMVAIGWDNGGVFHFNCGGSLISARFVLTAGHCTFDRNMANPIPVAVRLGDHNIDPTVEDGANPVEVAIKNIIKHPNYESPNRYNDIALLELVADVEFNSEIRPACLWPEEQFAGKDLAVATGWGVVNPVTYATSKVLQKVSLSIIPNKVCNGSLANLLNRLWREGFRDTQMCAGELRGGRDTCAGDSGSPLQLVSNENQCIFYVIGVTSFGPKTCGVRPAVYTRVSSYLDWIESVVWPGE